MNGAEMVDPPSSLSHRPPWRSLILKLDVKAHPHRFVGKDRLISAFLLPPGIIFGIWRVSAVTENPRDACFSSCTC